MDQKENLGDGANSTEEFWQNAQQVLQAGQDAATLLNAPVYNLTYRMKMEGLINEWMTTSPKEVNRRESLYYQTQALREVTQGLSSLVEQANVILAEQSARQDPSAKQNEYLDTQGFTTQ